MRLHPLFLLIGMLFAALSAPAAEELVEVSTRPNIATHYFWKSANSPITVLLVSKSNRHLLVGSGVAPPLSDLIVARDAFASAGFNVALMSHNTYKRLLGKSTRYTPPARAEDIRAIVQDIRKRQDGKLWLVGPSLGESSSVAAAAAAASGTAVDGLVLSLSVADRRWKPRYVNEKDLGQILVPTLLYFHKDDPCHVATPVQAEAMLKKFIRANPKKLIELKSLESSIGNPCTNSNEEGYATLNEHDIAQITDWIKQSMP